MSGPVHFEVEVLYETLDGAACGNQRGPLTDDPAEVTCATCRELCGFDEQLTEVRGDPLLKRAA